MIGKIDKKEFLQEVNEAIKSLKQDRLIELINKGLAAGFTPLELLQEGIYPPLQKSCRELQSYDITFAELLLIVFTIKAGIDLLVPEIKASIPKNRVKGRVVIGTVKGDIHDIGKTLVAAVFESGGYEVTQLGCNVPNEEFIRAAVKEKADIIAASTLMTPTLLSMEELITEIKRKKMKVKTIIGGWSTSPEFAQKIGADAWGEDAIEGLKKLDILMKK